MNIIHVVNRLYDRYRKKTRENSAGKRPGPNRGTSKLAP